MKSIMPALTVKEGEYGCQIGFVREDTAVLEYVTHLKM